MQSTKRQFLLFLVIGAMNTLFGYSCFAFFIFLGFHYAIASCLAYCFGIIFNFHTLGKIVFKNFNLKLIFKFVGVYIFLYCLNVTIIKSLQVFSSNYYLTGFLAVMPVAMVAFLLNKYVVFRDKNETNQYSHSLLQ